METTAPIAPPTDDIDLDAPPDVEAAARIQARMEAADPTTATETAQVDYFGTDETFTYMLPDGKSYIVHKKLNEGSRRKYLNEANRDVVLERGSGNARMSMRPGDERFLLLKEAIVDWNLMRSDGRGGMAHVPCKSAEKEQFLTNADPGILDGLERDVRAHNDWLMQDMTVEAIDEQIKDLQEQRERLVNIEAGKAGSAAS